MPLWKELLQVYMIIHVHHEDGWEEKEKLSISDVVDGEYDDTCDPEANEY